MQSFFCFAPPEVFEGSKGFDEGRVSARRVGKVAFLLESLLCACTNPKQQRQRPRRRAAAASSGTFFSSREQVERKENKIAWRVLDQDFEREKKVSPFLLLSLAAFLLFLQPTHRSRCRLGQARRPAAPRRCPRRTTQGARARPETARRRARATRSPCRGRRGCRRLWFVKFFFGFGESCGA